MPIQTIPISFLQASACGKYPEVSKVSTKVEQHIDKYDLEDLGLPSEILSRLFEHQKVGVQWMFNLWVLKRGGILGSFMRNITIMLYYDYFILVFIQVMIWDLERHFNV